MLSTGLLIISVACQFTAAFLALRLIKVTGKRLSWILISSAIVLMGLRQCITLYRLLTGDIKHPPNPTAEWVALLISVLMLIGIYRIHIYFREIKKSAEERWPAEKLSTRLGRILDNSFNEIYLFDAETLKFVQVNLGARKNLGFAAKELSNLTPLDLKAELTAEEFDEILSPLRSHQKNLVVFETIHKRKNGMTYPVSVRLQLMHEETPPLFVAIIEDITERKLIEQELETHKNHLEGLVQERTKKMAETIEELKDSESQILAIQNELEISSERLRELNKKLQSIREEEKLHLAREIHDELGQVITYCKLDLLWIKKELKNPGQKIDRKLESMVSHLDDVLGKVRRISSELRPEILDVMGISEAIKWQVQQFMNQTHIECEMDIVPERIECERDLSIDLFRIFQETLTNISRHAEATLVRIKFIMEENYYKLIVIDNGKGFDATLEAHSQSLGFLGMKERALNWGGQVDIQSQPEVGTTVTVILPIKNNYDHSVSK